ncbi:MAG: rRNA maturation RNase YbeY [Kiloniellales bacterium]
MRKSSATASTEVTVLILDAAWKRSLPHVKTLAHRAADAALASAPPAIAISCPVELSIVLVDDNYSRELNRQYRCCDTPTNVLSFASQEASDPSEPANPLQLGDVVLSRETLERESAEQHKPLPNHFCHLVVHGVLHLLGFDHQSEPQASEMEAFEVSVLSTLGIGDPYRPYPTIDDPPVIAGHE